ncbi:hypothetical protein ACJJIF_15075 [Microbulbifer sp. SSSA002]|uniref:hypothetical protein n=1 Tax=Microbulbifer sp. SSSA002 TaxID=3243376 RepID=UPI00403A793B
MAIVNANIGLAANYLDGRKVRKSDFVDKLNSIDSPDIKGVIYNRVAGLSSIIVFIEDELSNYHDQKDPDAAFEQALAFGIDKFTDWLKTQESSLFKTLKNNQLKVWVFIELWIEDDQLDINFPPKLLTECGRLNISIDIVTND